MRVHYLKHIKLEGLGYIESWLNEKNLEYLSSF